MGGSRLIALPSSEATLEFGRCCAPLLSSGSVLALLGELGAGKTTFVQGLALGLSIADPVQSPTFHYLHIYEGATVLHHFDLYRMQSSSEFFFMGFDEYFLHGVTAIEWAERLDPSLLPAHTIFFRFLYEKEARQASISSSLPSKLIDFLAAWD